MLKTDKRAFNIKEAAEYACVSRGTIETWINKRLLSYEELPSKGDGKHRFRLIRKTDLDGFLTKYLKSNRDEYSEIKQNIKNQVFLIPRKDCKN